MFGHGNRIDGDPDGEALLNKSEAVSCHLEEQQSLNYKRLQRWNTVLTGALGVAMLALLSVAAVAFSPRAQSTASLVPQMPTVTVPFERDDRFAGPSTKDRDEAWSAMMPPGDGFVLFSNETAAHHGIPFGKSTARGQIYDISIFHQLHCLKHIRTHLFTLQALMARNNQQEIYDLLLRPSEDHVFHCFDYLRQGLMCAGDMTLEWPRTEEDGARFAVDGWGITHECKDWAAVMEFTLQHAAL